jgi:hypothetical protein
MRIERGVSRASEIKSYRSKHAKIKGKTPVYLPVARWFYYLLESVNYGYLSWGLLLLVLDPIINSSLLSLALYRDYLLGFINIMRDLQERDCPGFL